MRTLFFTGLLLATVGLCSADSISFDDLYNAADSYDHPPVVKEAPPAKPEDPEMKEWSTEHLLGLDEPVPEHMFDDLQAPKKKKRAALRPTTKKQKTDAVPVAVKKAAEVQRVAPKEAKLVEEDKDVPTKEAPKATKEAPKATEKARPPRKKPTKATHKKVHMVNPHDILNNLHEDPEEKSADDLADMLIGTEDVEPAQPAKKVAQKKKAAPKKVTIKNIEVAKTTKAAVKTIKDVKGNEDEQLVGANLPRVVHHRTQEPIAKTAAHEKGGLLSLPTVVDDADDEQPELKHHPMPAATLQGMASKFLKASEQKDHVSATKQARADALAKKQVDELEQEKKAEEAASNGHVVHLDLSADDADAVSESPKAEDEENLSDMLSVGDDDDDFE